MYDEKEVATILRPMAARLLRVAENEITVDVRRVRKGRPRAAVTAEEIAAALEEHGTQDRAAGALGISARTLRSRIAASRSPRPAKGSQKSTRTGK